MNILVCCGSKQPDNLFFREASRAADLVANFITSHNHNLVFGGSKSGLMGIVSKGVEKRKNANSQIFICTLKKWAGDLDGKAMNHKTHIELYDKICDRKEALFQRADVIVVLPGGPGTVDEFNSAVESKLAQEHNKAIIVFNCAGYFDKMIEMLDETIFYEFASDFPNGLFFVADNTEVLEELLQQVEEGSTNEQ